VAVTTRPFAMMVSKAIGSSVELAEQAFYAKLRHLGARIKTKNLNHKGH
jgi:hypothetical protein